MRTASVTFRQQRQRLREDSGIQMETSQYRLNGNAVFQVKKNVYLSYLVCAKQTSEYGRVYGTDRPHIPAKYGGRYHESRAK